jgi:hypothetical protein
VLRRELAKRLEMTHPDTATKAESESGHGS